MKKVLFIVIPLCIVIAIIITLIVVNKPSEEVVNDSQQKSILTAEDVLLKLKESNSNIDKYIVYNEENDPNKLLGRPNQYISKVVFQDARLKNEELGIEDISQFTGGTIEVFDSQEDMQKRKAYTDAIASSMSMFAQYSYSNDYILLRLSGDLTPSQAKEYEEIFNNIFQ